MSGAFIPTDLLAWTCTSLQNNLVTHGATCTAACPTGPQAQVRCNSGTIELVEYCLTVPAGPNPGPTPVSGASSSGSGGDGGGGGGGGGAVIGIVGAVVALLLIAAGVGIWWFKCRGKKTEERSGLTGSEVEEGLAGGAGAGGKAGSKDRPKQEKSSRSQQSTQAGSTQAPSDAAYKSVAPSAATSEWTQTGGLSSGGLGFGGQAEAPLPPPDAPPPRPDTWVTWVSVDPRQGNVMPYPADISKDLEEADAAGRDSLDLGDRFFGAKVYFKGGRNASGPFQRTAKGLRDVRRIELSRPSETIVVFVNGRPGDFKICDEPVEGAQEKSKAITESESVIAVPESIRLSMAAGRADLI